MLGQDHLNQLFNNNSRAFGDTTEQQFKAGTYKRGNVFLNQVKKMLPDREAYVLDYGCGTGRISMILGQEGYRVLAVDPAVDHIQIAHSLNTFPNVEFSVLNDDLKIPLERFDAVVSSSVLEFVPDVDQYIQSIYGVLKVGGVVFVSVPNVYSLWRVYSKFRFGKKYKHFQFQKNVFTQGELRDKFRIHNLQAQSSRIYFESVFDQKGLGVLNKSVLFGTLVLLTFVKR